MGLVRELLSKSIDIVREEILPLRTDLIKAGLLKPEQTAYDSKASLVDPYTYGQIGYGYKERYSILDYVKCRQITYADPVIAAVLQTRINQVASFAHPQFDKYKVGFKVVMRDDEAEPTDADKKRIRELETFVMNCGVPESFEDTPELKRRDSFEAFIRKITRDSLTFDQINFEVTPRKNGLPYLFRAVDAATIRLIPDLKENSESIGQGNPQPWADSVMSFGSEKVFKEFEPKHARYAQVINGIKRHVFDEWEMAFGVRNPRTDLLSQGYGFSEIEMLVTTITSHMNAETYNRKFFSQGSSIKGILNFEGSVPPDQLEAFRRQWYAQVTGVNNAWRTPIMSLGKDSKLNWTSLHSTNREMEFGKWMEYCIKTICGVFQMDPIEIGFDISRMGAGQNSSGGGGLGQGNQAERILFSQDKGLRPLLRHIQHLINEYVIWRLDPNFEFEFVGLNVGDEQGDLEKVEKKVKTFKTINEIRAEHDMEPLLDFDKIKNPGDLVLDSSLITFISSQMQAAQQAEMGGAEGDQAGAVEPPPEEEEPDYENMSPEELQAELAKLEAEDAQAGGASTPGALEKPTPGGNKHPQTPGTNSAPSSKPPSASPSGLPQKPLPGKGGKQALATAGVAKSFTKELEL